MRIIPNNTTNVEFDDFSAGRFESHENKVKMIADMLSGLRGKNMESYRCEFSPKIEIIKMVRSQLDCGLRTAKVFVEDCTGW